MNLLINSSSSSNAAHHTADADRKEQAQAVSTAAITSSEVRKFKDGSSPSLYPLFNQTLESVLGPHQSKSDDGKGQNFAYPLFPLIANYEDEIIGEHFLSSVAFGKKMWNDWFGDIGEVPPLPKDVCSILQEPCPFNPEKKVVETHMLVLVPEKLNGTPMTLNRFGKLMEGIGKAGYEEARHCGGHQDTPFEASHWVLMTKTVIDGSLNESYEKQLVRVEKYPNYRVPKLSEAVAAIFMEYVTTGIYHFNSKTYTYCQETCPQGWQIIVGEFSEDGLSVRRDAYQLYHVGGIAVVRKLG